MKYLHTMVRVTDIDASLDFYCNKLGLTELKRYDSEQGRFTLVFLAAPGDDEAQVELTHNWDPEAYDEGRNFGHLAYQVDDIYALCQKADGRRCNHQSAAARRAHGVCTFAGQHLDRIAAKRRVAAAQRALGINGKHRALVALRRYLAMTLSISSTVRGMCFDNTTGPSSVTSTTSSIRMPIPSSGI